MRAGILIIAIIGLFVTAGQVSGITLANKGKTNYSIIISNSASPSEQHGAEELRHFLQIITGAYFPILRESEKVSGPAILVGNSSMLQKIDASIDFNALGDEGFIMKTAGPNLILAGGKLRGSMYAVYTFLEKLGCRWYTPEVSKIPSMPRLSVEPFSEIQKPAFAYREPFWFSAFDGDWAARNKCNSSRAELDEKHGGRFRYWGGHSFYRLVPPAKYFGEHPEYYSLANGRRIWEYAQLCMTNAELIRLMTKNTLEVIKEDPWNNVYEISQNDWMNWCACPGCAAIDDREESHSGAILTFINHVADRIGKYYPEKLIGTFAYWYSEKAPKSITARDNVCIRLCNIVGCDAHSLTGCEINVNRFAKSMEGWRRAAKNIVIWDYVTDFTHYLQPYPNWFATWKDIQYFKQNKVIGIFEEGAFQSKASAGEELEAYIQAKNFWNPDLDYREILDDFLDGYYHKAAPAIRKYMDFLQEQVDTKDIHFGLYSPPTIEGLFTPENIAQCERYFDEAERLVKNDPDAAYRVEEARLGIRYVKLARPVERILEGDIYRVSPAASSYANLSEADKFIEDVKMHGITAIRENGTFENAVSILRANVSDHRVVALENPFIHVDVIPDLGGKMYRIIDRKSSRNYLRIPSLNEYHYAHAGYLIVHQELISRSLIGGSAETPSTAAKFSFMPEPSAGGQKISMEAYAFYGRTSNALKVTRSIYVPADKNEIEISSGLECLVETPNPVKISPAFDLALGDPKKVMAGVRKPGESFEWKKLRIDNDDWGHAIPVTFGKTELESGVCAVLNAEDNSGILCVFNPEEVEVVSVIPDTATNGVFLSLHGNQRQMKPGDKISLSYKIIPISDAAAFLKN